MSTKDNVVAMPKLIELTSSNFSQFVKLVRGGEKLRIIPRRVAGGRDFPDELIGVILDVVWHDGSNLGSDDHLGVEYAGDHVACITMTTLNRAEEHWEIQMRQDLDIEKLVAESELDKSALMIEIYDSLNAIETFAPRDLVVHKANCSYISIGETVPMVFVRYLNKEERGVLTVDQVELADEFFVDCIVLIMDERTKVVRRVAYDSSRLTKRKVEVCHDHVH